MVPFVDARAAQLQAQARCLVSLLNREEYELAASTAEQLAAELRQVSAAQPCEFGPGWDPDAEPDLNGPGVI